MERDIEVEETLQADEVFCTGTAMGVKSVASMTYYNRRQVILIFINSRQYIQLMKDQ